MTWHGFFGIPDLCLFVCTDGYDSRPFFYGKNRRALLQEAATFFTGTINQLFTENISQNFYKKQQLTQIREGLAISELFINEQIRDREVRVIGENGEQLGIMSAKEALQLADEAGLDLVKVAPGAQPPVCKIVDYGKYKYEQSRKEKEARKKQHVIEIKEIRLSPNIDTNDLNTKVNAARKFLTKGDRVKVTLRFRGREMAHMNTTKHVLDDFAEALADIAVVDKPPKVEGRTMIMFLTEKK